MQDLQEMWQKVIFKMQNLVSFITYDVWISKLEPLELTNDNKLILYSPSNAAKQQILNHHSKQLLECVHEVFGEYVDYEEIELFKKSLWGYRFYLYLRA